MDTFHGLCDKRTGKESAMYFIRIADAIAGDAIDLTCGQYSSRDVCFAKAPKIMRTFAGLAIENKTNSVFVPLIGALKLLDSPDSY